MQYDILIIENGEKIQKIVKTCLGAEDVRVDIAERAIDGLLKIIQKPYELVIMNVTDWGRRGKELLIAIRKLTLLPVLILADGIDQTSKVDLLSAGADEVLNTLPVIEVFRSRTKAMIRRYLDNRQNSISTYTTVSTKNFLLCKERRMVFVKNHEIKLTKMEFDILYYLVMREGEIVTNEELYHYVWREGYNDDDTNIISHIHRIRKKMSSDFSYATYIQNVRGIGYYFCDNE